MSVFDPHYTDKHHISARQAEGQTFWASIHCTAGGPGYYWSESISDSSGLKEHKSRSSFEIVPVHTSGNL